MKKIKKLALDSLIAIEFDTYVYQVAENNDPSISILETWLCNLKKSLT